jgi:hypothetical protein
MLEYAAVVGEIAITILMGIGGMSKLLAWLLNGGLSDEEKELLSVIKSSGIKSFDVGRRGTVWVDPEEVRNSWQYKKLLEESKEFFK